uniref:PDZ domain-containing protein n=1 Tax=Knipowitschia caucasica TaxID=637954 RepID=A0AAV2J3W7_KNICA
MDGLKQPQHRPLKCYVLPHPRHPHDEGVSAGDEILQLNGKDSLCLTFSDMKTAFSKASLSLTVSTLPPVDRRQLCFLPPRRSGAEDDLYTDIFSQSQGEL